jgi:hypothetical protein
VKDLKHLFGVFLERLLSLTNQDPPNTLVSQYQSPRGPDMVRQVLEYASAEHSNANSLSPTSRSDEQENIPGPDGFNLKHPIYTTLENF